VASKLTYSDTASRDEQEKLTRQQLLEQRIELKTILQHPEVGFLVRKYFWKFSTMRSPNETTFTGNSWGNFYEGQRMVCAEVIRCIKDADLDSYFLMEKEHGNHGDGNGRNQNQNR
jgi:hypothetical protein